MKLLKPLITTAALALALTASAIPALRVTKALQQPDGSVVNLTLTGDEFCHYYLTDDGQVVVQDGNGYYFACPDQEGLLVASKVLAADPGKRNAQQLAFVNSLSEDALTEAIVNKSASSPLRRSAQLSDETQVENVSMLRSRAEGDNHQSAGIGRISNNVFPTEGKVNGLMILVEYQDVRFSGTHESTYDYFYNLLNKEGFDEENATGSARDYFFSSSNGVFEPTFDVLGPVLLPHNQAYYGGSGEENAYKMVIDAADILYAQGVDFMKYDNDDDCIVENVFIFYAGIGENVGGGKDAVWPHQANLSNFLGTPNGYEVGDAYLDSYACSCELLAENEHDGIGAFCHEFSHVFGLPDLYDVIDGSAAALTPGQYDLMDAGAYLNDSRTPPAFSTFERNALRWIDLEVISEPCDIELPSLCSSNKGYIILSSDRNEFFTIENRQKEVGTWDRYIPGHGMLIWHVTYNSQRWNKNIVNTIATKQYVDIIEAGGVANNTDLNKMKTYPFPGTKKVYSFDNFATWKLGTLDYAFTDIKEANNKISFKVNGGATGIADIAADGKGVNVNGREISVEGADGIDVFDLTGRKVASGTDAVTVPSNGLYLVRTAHGAAKIAIQ